jgi:hypothetical protein
MPFSRIKAGFLAGVAMLVLVPSAQAQFTVYDITSSYTGSELTVDSLNGAIVSTNVVGSASFTTGPTATTNSLSFAGTIDGYTISVSGSFNPGATSGPGTLAYTTSLTPVAATANFFAISTGAGDYTTPLGGNLIYTNTQTSSGLNTTNPAAFQGTLIADNGLNTYTANSVGSLKASNTTSQIVAAGTLYDLTQSGLILTDGSGPVSQTMTSVVAAPEPNGVLIGLLGLPCMGVVVYFARRRTSAMAAA